MCLPEPPPPPTPDSSPAWQDATISDSPGPTPTQPPLGDDILDITNSILCSQDRRPGDINTHIFNTLLTGKPNAPEPAAAPGLFSHSIINVTAVVA